MKRLSIVVVLAMILALSTISLASAITYGELDGDGHPYVGMALMYETNGDYYGRCTGTLISPTVFLTAGHCTYGLGSAKVLFDADLTNLVYPYSDCGPYACYTGTPIPHPDYDDFASFPANSDVGVIILNEPVIMDTYGVLPAPGYLEGVASENIKKDIIFRTVGYGRQSVKPYLQIDRVRYTSTSMLVSINNYFGDGYNLQTTNNPSEANGRGGSCFGDSGGPVFYPEDSNIVVAVVSFGMNGNCKGVDWSYRVDTTHAQDFIYNPVP